MDDRFMGRFWSKVEKTDRCWLWTGSLMTAGYGRISIGRHGYFGAHRVSFEIAYGPFDKSMMVCHHCDIKRCVRPDHLFLGTQTDNMRDCAEKGRNSNCYRWTKEDNPNAGKPMPDRLKKAMSERKKRPFRFIGPSGTLIEGINLTQFCKDNGLNQGAMWSVSAGNIRSHKGYTQAP